jgi:hypothetical protein
MSTTARFPLRTAPNQDNTARVLDNEYQAPVYAASIALKLNAHKTVVKPATLTGALSMTAETDRPKIGDELNVLFLADGTGRTVTFSTGFAPSATLVVAASKRASATFIFDGAAWVETGRAIQA